MGDRIGQFKVSFCLRTTIKGQALANFIVEFTYFNAAEVTKMTNSIEVVKATGVREKENSVPIKKDAE